ncbi:LysE family translocator [Pedobacter sp. NJ-S-72]
MGIGTGTLVHTLLAAFGLSLIISESILLFNIIKYAGAAYIIYIGLRMLFGKSQLNTDILTANESANYFKIYRDGIITNVLNPKVALFFIAFLPQFIDPGLKNTILPFLTLGLTFITTGTLWCLILAVFASALFIKLKNNKRISDYINKFCGITLVGLVLKSH